MYGKDLNDKCRGFRDKGVQKRNGRERVYKFSGSILREENQYGLGMKEKDNKVKDRTPP